LPDATSPPPSRSASARDDSEAALAALAALADSEAGLLVIQAGEIVLPPGCVAAGTGFGVQMILERTPPEVSDARIERLGEDDAQAMLELALLTKPGPFTLRAQALGEFFGVKEQGRLVAMAGERMKQEGFTEVSGVCVHPDFQGRGLGRLLSVFMTHRILARRETPYLHAYATNDKAIALYETIGFKLRTMMNVTLIRAGEQNS
jgi:ribosomal protein S18 acetylase RimI-like enzyme